MRGRALAWAGGAVVVMTVAGLGAYLGVAGLSKANELAGVIGGFVGLAGLVVAAYGVVQAHKDAVTLSPDGPGDGQSVSNTTARTVTQVKDATGNVRIGKVSPAVPPSPPVPSAPPVRRMPSATPSDIPTGGQTVIDSSVSGDVTQVQGVGGDVDIDR
jgi:hypothetical protein